MLTDHNEIALAARAREPGIRDPRRSAAGIHELLSDFFRGIRLDGQRVLELGPGHYEFAHLLASKGAAITAVENDPPIAEIGRRRGYGIVDLDLKDLPRFRPDTPFDGLFSKGSTNPFWTYGDEAALREYVGSFVKLTTDRGWSWVASCPYLLEPLPERAVVEWLTFEHEVLAELGFDSWPVGTGARGPTYGISVPCDGLYVFTRNLPSHRWSASSRARHAYLTIRRTAKRVLEMARAR